MTDQPQLQPPSEGDVLAAATLALFSRFLRCKPEANWHSFRWQHNCLWTASASLKAGSLPYGIFTPARLFRRPGTVT
jgi:hypothetical protein